MSTLLLVSGAVCLVIVLTIATFIRIPVTQFSAIVAVVAFILNVLFWLAQQ